MYDAIGSCYIKNYIKRVDSVSKTCNDIVIILNKWLRERKSVPIEIDKAQLVEDEACLFRKGIKFICSLQRLEKPSVLLFVNKFEKTIYVTNSQ